MSSEENQLKQEYLQFKQDPGVVPPKTLSLHIKTELLKDLNPGLGATLGRTLALHAVSGALTLAVCPQFGLGPIGGGKGLMGFVEAYGHVACGLFCGGVFMSLTAILAPLWLGPSMRRVLARNPLAMAGALTLTSLGVLLFISFMIGGGIPHLHPEFVLAWIGAAMAVAYGLVFRTRFER